MELGCTEGSVEGGSSFLKGGSGEKPWPQRVWLLQPGKSVSLVNIRTGLLLPDKL